MDTGLLHLHNFLRWAIILLLIITLYQAFTGNPKIKKTSLWLMISAHIMLLVGLYQVIAGRFGIMKGLPEGVQLMKDSFYRFYWVEHPLLMIVAIVLITLARGKAKALNYKTAGWLLLVAIVFILVAVPWPFREGIGRPWFPGM
jgi:uncharacterized membrane protein